MEGSTKTREVASRVKRGWRRQSYSGADTERARRGSLQAVRLIAELTSVAVLFVESVAMTAAVCRGPLAPPRTASQLPGLEVKEGPRAVHVD